MSALMSAQGRVDGSEPEKYRYEMLRINSYQFLDSRNYLCYKVTKLHCSQLAHRAAPQAVCW